MSESPKHVPRSCLATLIALILGVTTTPVAADSQGPYIGLDDDEVLEVVERLRGFALDYEADDRTGVVYLDHSARVEVSGSEYGISRSGVLHALRDFDEDEATRTVAVQPGEEVVHARGWVVEGNDQVRWLSSSDVRIDISSVDGRGEVVLAFPSPHEGQTYGWSVVVRAEEPMGARLFPIDADVPVAYGTFTLQTNGRIGYTVQAFNVRRDDFAIQTGEPRNGNDSRIQCVYRDLRPDRVDPLGLPWRQRRAHLLLNFKGYFSDNLGMWITIRSWNRIALLLEEELAEAVEASGAVEDRAEQLVEGLESDRARCDALYRFVRDEIATLDLGESFEFRSSEEVLEARTGDGIDKAALLVALMRSVGVDARLGFARHRYAGGLFHEDPGFWQFTDGVVVVGDPRVSATFYVPGVEGCPARMVPPHLRGVDVVLFGEDLEKRSEELYRRAYAEDGGVERRLVQNWLRRIRAADWTQIVSIGGDPRAVVGVLRETRIVDPEIATATVSLTSEGITTPGAWARGGIPPEELARRYSEQRGRDPETVREASVEISTDDAVVACRWVEDTALPPRTGNAWILNADVVFGTPFLDSWKGGDRGAVYIPMSWERVRRTVVPLPPGWGLAEEPPSVDIINPLFHYRAETSVEDGRLVVERSFRFRAGERGERSLPVLDRDAEQVLDHETRDLVLVPEAADDTAAASGDR